MKKRTSKLLSLLLTLTMVLGMLPFMSTTAMAATVLIGDVDANGTVNKADSILLDRYVANWTGYADKVNMDAADVNRDGNVNKDDAILLARYIAKWTVESQIGQTVEVGEPEELKIVKEPQDVEFLDNVATLSITVSGEFDDIVYNWQKETSTGWREAISLNSTDVTYTVNNSALQITSKNGTEGLGKYRCIVSAFNKGSLVAQVTSRVAEVDPQAAPMKALLGVGSSSYPPIFYYYHLAHTTDEIDEETGMCILEQPLTRILKSYSSQSRFEEVTTPRKLIPSEYHHRDDDGKPLFFIGSVDGYYDAEWDLFERGVDPVYEDENGDWWIIPASSNYNHYYSCSIQSLEGGKGPYTYTWYLSKDRFGNDFQPLIEGKNCYGQGTEEIRVWAPYEPSKGMNEPYFMGFLCCRITDSKGRTVNATNAWYYGGNAGEPCRGYNMIYAMNENNTWFESPNSGNMWWWAKQYNTREGLWF